MSAALLEIDAVHRRFGGVHALRGVSFELEPGAILGLLGANGSGKTTLLSIVAGARRPSAGRIRFGGRDVTGRAPERLAKLGIARTFQQSMTFPAISVHDNMRIVTRDHALIADVAARLGFERHMGTLAGSLSHGQQRLLGVGLALLTKPRLLLLDEPAAGLSRHDSALLAEVLAGLREDGLTMVVVDHDMAFVLPLSDRVVVLNAGELLYEGSATEMRESRAVQEAYLGIPA